MNEGANQDRTNYEIQEIDTVQERNKGKFQATTLLKAWSKTSPDCHWREKCLEGKPPKEKHGINRSFNKFGHVGNCTKWLWEQLGSRNIIGKQKMTKGKDKKYEQEEEFNTI